MNLSLKKETTDKVKKFFNNYADEFNSIYSKNEKRSLFNRIIDKLFRHVLVDRYNLVMQNSKNPNIKSIIDIGCGPGHYCAEFLIQDKVVTGVDIAIKMLDIAKSRIMELDLSKNFSAIHADYLNYPFSEKFDAACLMGFFDYIEDPVPILKKLKNEIRQEIYASFPKSEGILAKQRKFRYWLRKCPLYLYTQEDIIRLLSQADITRNYEIVDLKRDLFVKIKIN